MKTTLIKISNVLGIKEIEIDGRSIELTGANGTGKSSVIDAIKRGFTNRPDRPVFIREGANEGEILIQTDTGLSINRKFRTNKADYKSIKNNGKEIPSPEGFLSEIFTELQLNPVKFIQMDEKEQNRMILDLINFQWDLSWIINQFGEVPDGVDYGQNILQVLNEIQADNGSYFQNRQDINREIRHKKEFISEIVQDIPENYQPDKWRNYSLSGIYQEIEEAREHNARIENAERLKANFDNQVRGFEATKELAIAEMLKGADKYKNDLELENVRLEEQIKSNKEKLSKIAEQKEQKLALFNSEFEMQVAKIDADLEANKKYLELKRIDFSVKQEEAQTAEKMKSHLNEYERMRNYQKEVEELTSKSEELTRKIELARSLPGEILKTANLPIENLTIDENGIPLINNRPVSNLSKGQKLDLCVDITIAKQGMFELILLDEVECLSDVNREKLYAKCKSKGIQYIAARTTNESELKVNYL